MSEVVNVGPLTPVAEPNKELLALTLTCISKAQDAMPAAMPLMRELLRVLRWLTVTLPQDGQSVRERIELAFQNATPPTSEKE